MPPDYVVIGHVAKDLTPRGYTVGGTVTYAALTAHRLGYGAGIVTSHARDLDTFGHFNGIDVVNVPTPVTTTFENVYNADQRRQYIHAVAAPIPAAVVPRDWHSSPIVHIGPLAGELAPDIIDVWDQGTLIGVTPQGWMRQWDDAGRVRPRHWRAAEDVLQRADVVILSEEDVAGFPGEIERLAGLARLMVVTRGWAGATVFIAGRPTQHSALDISEVDPTGAGDVFAAAFLIRLYETGDPHTAARFANRVAGFSVLAPGVTGIPLRAEVEETERHRTDPTAPA
jgi:sugar/nucleoside kinase (ribokinase family)